MRRLFIAWLVCLSLFACVRAQSPSSMRDAISKATSAAASDRIHGFELLGKYWDRRERRSETGFSDTPVSETRTSTKPPISEIELDRIAAVIEKGLGDENADVRKAAAIAVCSVPRSSEAVLSAITVGINSDDATVNWYVAQQGKRTPPEMAGVIEKLIVNLSSDDFNKFYAASDQIRAYGSKARRYSDQVVDAILRSGSKDRSLKLYVLCDIGLTDSAADALAGAADQFSKEGLGVVAISLIEFPSHLKLLHKKRPELMSSLAKHQARLFPYLCKHQYEPNATRDWLASIEGLPANIMGMLGDPKFVDQLTEYEKDADRYGKYFVAACKRACGELSGDPIQVDSSHPVTFRPASAWPNTDSRRRSKTSFGHGDGSAQVVVTGRVSGSNGSVPDSIQFYRLNDGMLMGTKLDSRSPVLFDRQTGRFVFFTTVFAAYNMGGDPPERGPYQTGSAQIRIEAAGFKPLVVQFFDEIPDLNIVLELEP